MIIMDPDDVVGAQHPGETAGEKRVDAEISRGVAVRMAREIKAIVADRPERAVGEAVVIFGDVAARQVRHDEADRPQRAGLRRGIDLLRGLARPAEPDAAPATQGGLQRDGKSTRRRRPVALGTGTRFETTISRPPALLRFSKTGL